MTSRTREVQEKKRKIIKIIKKGMSKLSRKAIREILEAFVPPVSIVYCYFVIDIIFDICEVLS